MERTEELTNPRLEELETRLTTNHDEFAALSLEWGREWQREMVRHWRRKQRAQKASAPLLEQRSA